MAYFRTLESAEIPCQRGRLSMVTVKSPALRSRADITLFVPETPGTAGPLPVLLLLHGVYGSHWCWAFRGSAHTTLQAMIDSGEVRPMILAMPSDGLWGDGSGYLAHHGQDFEHWIVDDVPHAVAEVSGNPLDAPRFISGLSMGGFGALRLGAKYPDCFKAFYGHSSITRLEEMASFVEEPPDAYESTALTAEDHSVFETLLQNRERIGLFAFDCGSEDLLIEGNRALHRRLVGAAIPHTYDEFPGTHGWSYWETHFRDSLRFFNRVLSAN